jgi:pimeloyl-ACP methyl ester carboxylesterase
MPHSAPPIRVNATPATISVDKAALATALAALPAGAPVVVMIHGYRFAPGAEGPNCPHRHIFSLDPPRNDGKAISWPRHLGLDGKNGLAIAFGWQARGSLPSAVVQARLLGRRLAELAELIAQIDPGRKVDVIGHSLGARVALAALRHAKPGILRRLILLAGAETRRPARAALATPAGQQAEVLNITSRENDLFEFLFERLSSFGVDTAIGQGLGRTLPNWLDLQIDHPRTLDVLGSLGHTLPAPLARICHWSPYMRPGALPLCRAFIDSRIALASLRPSLPERMHRRWSRLFWPAQSLPFLSQAANGQSASA